MLILVVFFTACNDNQSHSAYSTAEVQLLKSDLATLQFRVDSLITALAQKQTPPTPKQKSPKTKKVKTKTTSQQPSTSAYNWQSTSTTTTPSYKKTKEQETYRVRTGAICCDGTRSYSTGRGTCSHHGGVCQWV
ncbi:MAG: DUF3761 domain-containing protein [Sphingobacteriales bacterium]|nr:MAG: DUF3761 domain-containing protein [Sphingobacteriales bacterium]